MVKPSKQSDELFPPHPESVLVDIKRPGFNYEHLAHYSIIDLRREVLIKKRARSRPVRALEYALGGFLLIFILFVGYITLQAYNNRDFLAKEAAKTLVFFSDPGEFNGNIEENEPAEGLDLGAVDTFFSRLYRVPFSDAVFNVLPFIKQSSDFFRRAFELQSLMSQFGQDTTNLLSRDLRFVFTDGEKFKSAVQKVKNTVDAIITSRESLHNKTKDLQDLLPIFQMPDAEITATNIEQITILRRIAGFMSDLEELVSRDEYKILVPVYRSSNIRSGGGEIAAVIELVFREGKFVNARTVLPEYASLASSTRVFASPQPLRYLSSDWRLRDLLWLSDPKSVLKVVSDVTYAATPSSSVQKEENAYAAVIFMDTRLLTDIKEVFGGIAIEYGSSSVPLSKTMFQNLLASASQTLKQGTGKNQISISLSQAINLVINRIIDANESEWLQLGEAVKSGLENKSMVFGSATDGLSAFFQYYALDRGMSQLSNNFWGSYLAPRWDHIIGNDSDEGARLNTELSIQIDAQGGALHDVSFSMDFSSSTAAKEFVSGSGYFLRTYLHSKTQVLSINGIASTPGNGARLKPESKNEMHNSLLFAETSAAVVPKTSAMLYREDDKTYVGAWIQRRTAQPMKYEMRYYTLGNPSQPMRDGVVYEFVYEPQKHVVSNLTLRVHAPIGFIFKETQSPTYFADMKDIRESLRLKLELDK